MTDTGGRHISIRMKGKMNGAQSDSRVTLRHAYPMTVVTPCPCYLPVCVRDNRVSEVNVLCPSFCFKNS